MVTRYRRVVDVPQTPERKRVWDDGHNGLVGHMTWITQAMTVAEVTEIANDYVNQYPEDFAPGFRFTEESVAASLDALVAVGLQVRESDPDKPPPAANVAWARAYEPAPDPTGARGIDE